MTKEQKQKERNEKERMTKRTKTKRPNYFRANDFPLPIDIPIVRSENFVEKILRKTIEILIRMQII